MTQTSLDRLDAAERRFEECLEAIAGVLGHADRHAPMRAYCTGLLLPGQRKSVEPLAARVAPDRVPAAHQSLHYFVEGRVARRGCPGGRARPRAAGHRAPRPDPAPDRR